MGPNTPRCGAKTRAGHPCRNPAGFRTDHPGVSSCAFHLGATRNGRIHAANEQAKQEAARLGLGREVTPHEALEHALALVMGEVDWVQRQVQDLDDNEALEDGKPHPLLRVYADAIERLGRIGKVAADAGVEARRLELDELVVERLVGAVRSALAEVDLTPDQQHRVQEAMTRHLRELDDLAPRPRALAA